MAGGAKFIKGHSSIYRNAWRNAAEEVRGILMKSASKYSANVSEAMVQACDDFVSYFTRGGAETIPIKSGNLIDSFGVAIFQNDTLYHLSKQPKSAIKRVRSGLESFEGEGGESRFGNPYWLVDGRNELELMAEAARMPNRTYTKFGNTYERGMITSVMYLAAPYARAVPVKGYWGGDLGAPRNDYYMELEDAFEVAVVDRIKNMYKQ